MFAMPIGDAVMVYGTHINVKTKLYSTILLIIVSIETKLLHAKNNMLF